MFVFYDTETTGLSLNFSQILQIALVFTDDDLNILSSKKLECRNAPWMVPSPGAMLTTGFAPDDLKFNKLSNYEMMREVDRWLRGQHWPLTFVGYNSVRYDEPVLAQNLHQNLLDPKLTSSRNGANDQCNGHADVMAMVKVVSVYMPGALKLDILNSQGQPSMTLKSVAQQNGVPLSDGDAHDAMNDIKATVGVARMLHKAAPHVWTHMMKLSTVDGVNGFLAANDLFTYATGSKNPPVVTSLFEREGSTTQALYNLSIDPAPYKKMSVEELKNVFTSREKGKPRPFLLARKDSQPALMPLELSEKVLPKNFDKKVYAARARAIRADKDFMERVAQAAVLAKEDQAAPSPQTALPEQLIDSEVAAPVRKRLDQWVQEFNSAEWPVAKALADDFSTRFKAELAADPALIRFQQFAARIVYEHAPEALEPQNRDAMKKLIAARILNPDPDVPYMTIVKARKELEGIEEKRAKGDKHWAEATDSQIRALKLYYTAIEKEYAPFAPALPRPANDNASQSPATPEVKKTFNGNGGPKV